MLTGTLTAVLLAICAEDLRRAAQPDADQTTKVYSYISTATLLAVAKALQFDPAVTTSLQEARDVLERTVRLHEIVAEAERLVKVGVN